MAAASGRPTQQKRKWLDASAIPLRIHRLVNLEDFGFPGGSRKTLILLGAGASRGASSVIDTTLPQPPLDLDFFQQVTRLRDCDPGRGLLQFVRREYQHEVGLSMERFFSEADYTDRFHRELSVDPGRAVGRYQQALRDFYEVLPALLNATTSQSCTHHDKIAGLLHAQDCIISFNYDCVMDRALRDKANRRWDPDKGGYGFLVTSGATVWRKHSRGHPVNTSIRLLKMHGSLNWRRESSSSISLVADPSKVSDLSQSIIPPTWFKNLTDFPYADVWKTARREVRSSRIIVVIGYSAPATDLFSRSLLKVEAGSKERREHLELLVLVNPDPSARRTFIDLMRGGIEDGTRIVELETLKALGTLFDRCGIGV